MEEKLKKKYGFFTAIAMVVGIVVGSGVFFKAERVLNATAGNLPLGILAWIIGGAIMVICAYVFAIIATRYEKVNGLIDYSEVLVGDTYGYLMGWFSANIYFPAMTSVLAWVSARYTMVLFGSSDITGGSCMTIACFYLVLSYALNALSPKLAGRFQVHSTIIKLIPLSLMAIIGTIAGLSNGILVENFTNIPVVEGSTNSFFTALTATVFAYEGWIIATSINAEIKDSKKNLPRALVLGTIFIVVIYVLYYIGLAGAVENRVLMEGGEQGARIAFSRLFSNVGGTFLFVFVVISCLGTLNGLMVASTRSYYSFASRGYGPKSQLFRRIDEDTNMPNNSSVIGLFVCAFWLLYFYGANLAPKSWFWKFSFDSSEIPIVTIYAMYIPIFINMMRKEKDLSTFRRFIMPAVAIVACLFMVVACIYAHRARMVYYLIIYAVVMVIGYLLKGKRLPENTSGETVAD